MKIKKINSEFRTNNFTGVYGSEKMDLLSEVNNKEQWEIYRDLYTLSERYKYTQEFPIQIDFELNATCNYKCPMCPLSVENNASKKELFCFDEYKKIIREGVKKGLKAIRLNYLNEPLLRKDISQFIKFARNNGVLDIYFSTNGLLLDQNMALELIDSGLTRIQISIDAFSEETYNRIRLGGNMTKVINNVLQLVELRKEKNSITPLIRVNFVKTELNENELDQFMDFWKDKVDMIGVQDMIIPPKSTKQLRSSASELREKFTCSIPNTLLTITNEGSVLPCCSFYGEELALGNIKTNNISSYWNSNEMKKLRDIHKNGNFYLNDVCRRCVYNG